MNRIAAMRIALITDMHGNREALDAVLAAARRESPDRFAILGDIVGYGPDPAYCVETVALLAEGGAIVLKGNHDEAVSLARADMNEMARDAISWTKTRLAPAHVAFLGGLSLQHQEGDAYFVHASADAPEQWHYVNTGEAAARCIAASPARFTFCGHTHRPAHWHLSPAGLAQHFTPQTGVALPLPMSRRSVTVIGAVGQPRDGKQAACFSILDLKLRTITAYRAPYDAEVTLRKIKAAGLPSWLGTRLLLGQ
jgi:diadenosine tetraphosphatase ApaH/serine/threonine PP2A family protein phosphatase